MRLGIDIRAAIHEPAGIGTLTLNLVKQLMREDRGNQYFLYGDGPFDFGISNERFHAVTKSFGTSPLGKVIWHPYATLDARYRRHLDRFVSIGSLQISALTRNFTDSRFVAYSSARVSRFQVSTNCSSSDETSTSQCE
jgi:hypothetical protein